MEKEQFKKEVKEEIRKRMGALKLSEVVWALREIQFEIMEEVF